ncbi:hypothetical protein A3I40_02445 [Candidatus Uhrbacteria bacterium RIFCSPLOWO2_02_FULL_48_12]|uniref:Uncharacterized protein n=1 Tax=Candidatus Uhrbacteria bacterium RIFCSPLOWO2_02_FULL_48_12 TaxID=1802407 RepID=A0A1F7V5Q8_9BACT|nr:MAG: hypothetical protein A3I40_02445 [Candidatus Uhrbacteria bacterium RIFCSPLOWO2_02_FULL_48_12]
MARDIGYRAKYLIYVTLSPTTSHKRILYLLLACAPLQLLLDIIKQLLIDHILKIFKINLTYIS